MRPPRALPTAHFDRNESHGIYGTGHYKSVEKRPPRGSRNTSELYQDVHSLKGSAANLGANRLVNLCGELEARCRSGPLEVAPALLAAIHQELAKVRADLLGYREHPSKAPSIPN